MFIPSHPGPATPLPSDDLSPEGSSAGPDPSCDPDGPDRPRQPHRSRLGPAPRLPATNSLLVARGLTDLDATLRHVVLPLPPGRDGSAETLIRLRAISAHLAQSAADTAQRRSLAEQLLRWDVVSHMSRMNRADGHQQRFPDSAMGGHDQESWHQLDALQACANANYMTLLGRLATSGVLTPEEVWSALSRRRHASTTDCCRRTRGPCLSRWPCSAASWTHWTPAFHRPVARRCCSAAASARRLLPWPAASRRH